MFDRKAYMKAYNKAYREKNKEKRKIYLEENKEKLKAQSKAWYEANKEKRKIYLEENKEKVKDRKHAYMRTYRREHKAKRRAAKLNRTPSWLTKEDLKEIKDIYRMARRRQEVEGMAYHVDHIIPLKGENISGLHVPSNLQILKARDNIRKGNKYG